MNDTEIHIYPTSRQGFNSVIQPIRLPGKNKGQYVIFENFQHTNGEVYHGLYFIPDDLNSDMILLCNPLYVEGKGDQQSKNSGTLVRFRSTINNLEQKIFVPFRDLQGDGVEFQKVLSDHGLLTIGDGLKVRSYLIRYIRENPTTNRFQITDHIGWHGNTYVMPNQTFGINNYHLMHCNQHKYSTKGTLEEWQRQISVQCTIHNRLVFALSVAFSGSVLSILGLSQGMGFHYVGTSSIGKTLSLYLASSIWGNPLQYILSWRSTANGLEAAARLHNDNFMALDEMSECPPETLRDSTYMLANSSTKNRMTKQGQLQDIPKWLIAYLSSGEKTAEEISASAGFTLNSGQIIRLIDIEADAGDGCGIFNHSTNPAALANNLKSLTSQYYGTAGIAWLEYLTNAEQSDIEIIFNKIYNKLTNTYRDLGSIQTRVLRCFAAVATSGEVASMAKITTWERGVAYQAACLCFENWLKKYGRNGSLEERDILLKVRNFIQENINTAKVIKNRAQTNANGPIEILGYLSKNQNLFYFTDNSFAKAIKPYTENQACKVLKNKGFLIYDKDRSSKKTVEHGFFDKKTRLYTVSTSILEFEPL